MFPPQTQFVFKLFYQGTLQTKWVKKNLKQKQKNKKTFWSGFVLSVLQRAIQISDSKWIALKLGLNYSMQILFYCLFKIFLIACWCLKCLLNNILIYKWIRNCNKKVTCLQNIRLSFDVSDWRYFATWIWRNAINIFKVSYPEISYKKMSIDLIYQEKQHFLAIGLLLKEKSESSCWRLSKRISSKCKTFLLHNSTNCCVCCFWKLESTTLYVFEESKDMSTLKKINYF